MSRTMRSSTWLRNASRTTSLMASKSASRSGRTKTSVMRGSRVVEERVVKADERARPLGVGAFDRLRAQVIHDVGGADALRQVSAPVVHLQEVAPVPTARRQPAVPRVGSEERHVAGGAVEDCARAAVVGE